MNNVEEFHENIKNKNLQKNKNKTKHGDTDSAPEENKKHRNPGNKEQHRNYREKIGYNRNQKEGDRSVKLL